MSDAGHHHDGPPGLPEITDEAGNTPTWVPLTGIALFALVGILIVARLQTDAPAADAPTTDAAADAADAPAAPTE